MARGARFLNETPWSCKFNQYFSFARSIAWYIQHTLLWRWMVYSRATTSAMADRVALAEGFLVFVDISRTG